MSKTMLVVDDSVVIQKMVAICFAQEDFSITYCKNAEDAFQKAQLLQPDVMLVDTIMPGKSGTDLVHQMRQNGALAKTPVLLLCGASEAMDDGKARTAGAQGYIIKPCESQILVAKVKEVMSVVPQAPAPSIPSQSAAAPLPKELGIEDFHPNSTIAASAPMSYEPQLSEFSAQSGFEEIVTETVAPKQTDEVDLGLDSSFFSVDPTEPLAGTKDSEHEDQPLVVEPDIWSLGADDEPSPEMHSNADFHDEPHSEPLTFTTEVTKVDLGDSQAKWPEDSEHDLTELSGSSSADEMMEGFVPLSDIHEVPTPKQEEPSATEFDLSEQKGQAFASATATAAIHPAPAELRLSDDQIEKIVSKVFEKVIERIAWDVVPTLADQIIREELKRLTKD